MEYTEGTSVGGASGPRGIRLFGGLLYVSASADHGLDRLNRDVRGRFTNMQTVVAETNRKLAAELADLMANELMQNLDRPGASKGNLKQALLDPRNRTADQHGFGVGNVDYLDNSDAKYWRAIEQGTEHFVGKRISGLWGEKVGDRPFGEPTTTERLFPMSQAKARSILRRAGYRRTKGNDELKTSGIIKNPIRPHHYMDNAWAEFDMHVRAAQLFRQIKKAMGL